MLPLPRLPGPPPHVLRCADPRAHLGVHLQQLGVQLLQLLGRQLLQDFVLVDVPVFLQLLPVGRHGCGMGGGLGGRGGACNADTSTPECATAVPWGLLGG